MKEAVTTLLDALAILLLAAGAAVGLYWVAGLASALAVAGLVIIAFTTVASKLNGKDDR